MHRTFKNLSQNKSIKYLKSDKRNGILLLNTTEYKRKMNIILHDTKKFKKLSLILKEIVIIMKKHLGIKTIKVYIAV